MLLSVLLLPEGVLPGLGAVCTLMGGGAFLLKSRRDLRLRLVCLGLALGFLWTAGFQARTLVPARQLDGARGVYTVLITGLPRTTRYGVAVDAELDTGDGKRLGAVLYAGEEYSFLRPGDRVSGEMTPRLANVSGGEETDYFYTKSIFLALNAKRDLKIVSPERVSLRFWPVLWSARLKELITSAFPAEVAPLVTGLVTGDKSGLDTGTYTALQRSGLAHTVAVSGLHVSFLAGFSIRLMGRNRRRTAACTILLMALFAGVAGYTPSVLRAAFLQSMLMLAPLLGREDDKPTSLSAALLLILLQNPYAGAGIGLQLSFAAAAGIHCCSGRLFRTWTDRLPSGRTGLRGMLAHLLRTIAAGLSATVGALVFTVPLTALYFGSLSLVSPLANLLALWASALAFAGGLGSALLGLLHSGLAAFLGEVFALPAGYVLWVAGKLSALPFASVRLENVYLRGWLLLVYLILLSALLLRKKGKPRPILPACACVCALCAALVCTAAEERMYPLTVSVLDVGQGQSVAFASRGRTALVDCGGNSRRDPGDVAADYFQSTGHRRLDLLVLTHFHADHAGGVPELLERMEVGTLAVPDVEPEDPLRREILALAEEKGTEIVFLRENGTASLGAASLRLYRPLGDGGANEEGLSVLCTLDDFDILMTGDMNMAVEKRLVKYGDLPDIELLLAGHHGSRYAVSPELLSAVRPEYAAVSVGYNSYGQPDAGTLERLAAAGCDIYRTDWMGRITFRVR